MIKITVNHSNNVAVFTGDAIDYTVGASPDYYLTITDGANTLAVFHEWTSVTKNVLTTETHP